MSMDEELQRLSKPKGFGESEFPTFEDLLLPNDIEINSREIIESYGRQLDLLRKQNGPIPKNDKDDKDEEVELSYSDLARIGDISVTAVRDIIEGKNKSINAEICNKFAKFFNCSSMYILGLSKHRFGVSCDNVDLVVSLRRPNYCEILNVVQAAYWARIDPELFKSLEKVFHLDLMARETIRKVLALIAK